MGRVKKMSLESVVWGFVLGKLSGQQPGRYAGLSRGRGWNRGLMGLGLGGLSNIDFFVSS